jgi:hypothetical protein
MEAYGASSPRSTNNNNNNIIDSAVAEMDTFMKVLGLTNNNNSNNFTAAKDSNDNSNKPKRRSSSILNTFRESMTLGIPTVLSGMDDDDDNNNEHVNSSNNNEDDNSKDQLVKQTKTSDPATDLSGMHINNAAASASGAATTMRKSIIGSMLRNVKYKSKKNPLGMDVSFIEGEERNEMVNNDDDDDDDEDQEEESDDDDDDDDDDDGHSNDEKGRQMKIQIKKNRFRD